MKTDAEIQLLGMQALIGTLGLIEAEKFLMAVNQNRFNYTEWRKTGLPDMSIEQIATIANQLSTQLRQS